MNKFIKKLQLSIIVINYNTKEVTNQCLVSILDSLREQDLNFEIILIDNASTDGSLDFFSKLSQEIPQINYIYNKKNLGFSKANNQGLKLAKGEYILLLNSDTIILNKAINKLLDFYQKNEDRIHFLGPKLLNRDFSPQPSAGYFFNLLVTFAVLFLKGDRIGLTRFSPSKIKKIDWISGACILTKKKILKKISGFDENIFMYMDEVDLLYRAKQKGYSTFLYPEVKIIHYGSASSNKTYPILQLYNGLIYFYKKHYSPLLLFFLKFMLYFKAIIGILVGRIFKSRYLIETYSQALKII